MAVAEAQATLVSGLAYSFVRLQNFPPVRNVAEDVALHVKDVTGLVIDPTGRLVFTCDSSGIILMSALITKSHPLTEAEQVPFPAFLPDWIFLRTDRHSSRLCKVQNCTFFRGTVGSLVGFHSILPIILA